MLCEVDCRHKREPSENIHLFTVHIQSQKYGGECSYDACGAGCEPKGRTLSAAPQAWNAGCRGREECLPADVDLADTERTFH